MKIEIDITKVGDGELSLTTARSAVVALLSLLPTEDAELAVTEWQAVLGARARVDQGEAPPWPVQGESLPAETAQDAAPAAQPAPNTSPGPPSYEQFSYGGRTFSTKKRGPSAAVDQALKDIASMTPETTGEIGSRIVNLKGILVEIERSDLADRLMDAWAAATSDISAPTSADSLPVDSKGNGAAQPASPDSPDNLRELLRKAGDRIGRKRVWNMLTAKGASRVEDLDDATAAELREEVTAAMEAA